MSASSNDHGEMHRVTSLVHACALIHLMANQIQAAHVDFSVIMQCINTCSPCPQVSLAS